MRYLLHTTADLSSLPGYLQDADRSAVWVHVASDDDRNWAINQCSIAGWDVLGGSPALPIYFVIAVRPTVTILDRENLLSIARPSQSAADIKFLGKLFGYSQEEIAWYIKQSCS